jgi:hypothetical protein
MALPLTSRAYRGFNLAFLSTVSLLSVAAACQGFWLANRTPVGDLARMGEYDEGSFGPTRPQEIFAQSLDQTGRLPAAPVDVIVLGDSFSHGMGGGRWQNAFCQETGLTVFTGDRVGLAEAVVELAQSAEYRRSPPRLVVLETVERSLTDLRTENAGQPDVETAAFTLPIKPRKVVVRCGEPRQSPAPRTFDRGLAGVRTRVRRALTGFDGTDVERRTLARNDLFSHARSGELLTFVPDAQTPHWNAKNAAPLQSTLLSLQRRLEVNHYTFVAVLIVPNKLTAYTPLLLAPEDPRPPFDTLKVQPRHDAQRDAKLHLVQISGPLQRAINAGVKDVYQPDDTHWSPVGDRIAALAVIAYLQRHKRLSTGGMSAGNCEQF